MDFFKKALFLDRDGIINQETNYVHKKEQVIFIDGIFELTKIAKSKGYKIFVITNQAGIARGYYTVRDFINLSKWMRKEFQKKDTSIDHFYFCPFHSEYGIGIFKKESEFRKPNPGMILKARDRFLLDLNSSVLVGDRYTDFLTGKSAGVGTNLILTSEEDEYRSVPVSSRISSLFEVIPYIV
ncbi:HAD family hydrolase [Leptospira sp. 201903070]|jgi:D-glycero-D-manno-heptose 1,7-bisphosphate phosphatase|uniref:D,D-heptose 1,7-bisphosphate phosphatase n=1 Tax=Leptospira ainlahdjerensis TaxID=2810033 RepID=A0ABS2UAD0_9LEPT|nr:HAD family hydrolase [Leptospira ainlahdjerensis]MBM9577323.1 HAD family hydrolase [Leptospira ainlahdjerensis]